jgi:hypothetical protein
VVLVSLCGRCLGVSDSSLWLPPRVPAGPPNYALTDVQEVLDRPRANRADECERPQVRVRERRLQAGGGSQQGSTLGNHVIDQDQPRKTND